MIKNIYKAESIYSKKDFIVRGFILFSVLIGYGVASMFLGVKHQPAYMSMIIISPIIGYLLLSFLIPFQTSIYFCSNFETGSIKNILASGNSRASFVIVKFLREAFNIFNFFICCQLSAYLSSVILCIFKNKSIIFDDDIAMTLYQLFIRSILGYVLILAFSAVTLFICMLFRKTTIGTIFTVLLLGLDIIIAIFMPDKPSYRFLKINLYFNKLMLLNEGFYFMDEHFYVQDISDLINALIMPVIIIIVFLLLSILVFSKKDVTV